MVVLKNLDFQTDKNTNFTELDPPVDQEYLLMLMKLCQAKMQSVEDTGNVNTIKGIQRNVKDLGQCFEAKALGETIRIPVIFLKKVGLFEIRKEDGFIYLEAIHLSYLEFCCAASLCRNEVNIKEELSKITDKDRYIAIVTYMAGMFAKNQSIEFLNHCRSLCQNFLHMLGQDEREVYSGCLQVHHGEK